MLDHRTFIFVSLGALCPLVVGCGATAPSAADETQDGAASSTENLQSAFGNALSHAEVRLVLKLIDDVCGDTWCEGDYDFRFRHVFCDLGTQTCTLAFQMSLRDGTESAKPWHWRTCRTGFRGFDSLVTTTSSGYRWLADGYYQELTACIEQWENT